MFGSRPQHPSPFSFLLVTVWSSFLFGLLSSSVSLRHPNTAPVFAHAFAVGGSTVQQTRSCFRTARSTCRRFSSSQEKDQDEEKADSEDETEIQRTSFDQAGASLIEEEDNKRMESMGDFDANPNVRELDLEKDTTTIASSLLLRSLFH